MPPSDHSHSSSRYAYRKQTGAARPQSGLFIVATPIGHARDITLRALDILTAADVIACEDTRVTAKLMRLYGIGTPTTPYHEHNAARAGPALIKRLQRGETVALVSDAGTPLISDPGYRLVNAAIDAGIQVTPIPGASAVTAALAVSGLPTDRFLFAGFPPNKAGARRSMLQTLAAIDATLVFFESGRRLAASLDDMAGAFGDRPAVVAREMTKIYEEMRRAPLPELATLYAAEAAPKGELAILVGPPEKAAAGLSDAAVDVALREALRSMSVKDAAHHVAVMSDRPRREIYARALALSARE